MNVIELFGLSTLPAIPNIINNRSIFIKIIWISSLLVLIAYCGIFLADTITSYLDYEVVTNIDVIREDKVQFPMVTLCVPKPINKTLDLHEFLITCSYDLVECNLDEDFEYYESQRNTQGCFRFNSGKVISNNKTGVSIKSATRSDPITGLSLSYLADGFIEHNLGGKTYFKSTLYIQNYSTHFRMNKIYNIESGIFLSPGTTLVSIERQIVQKLSKPYNRCVKQHTTDYVSNLFQYFIKNNLIYLQKDCFEFCVEEIILKECNCSQSIGEISRCYFEDEETKGLCINKKSLDYITKNQSLPNICLEKCPVECDSISYKKTQSYQGIPSDDYLKFLNLNDSTRSDIEKNGVLLFVYYQSLDYTLIKQIPKMKQFDLVSNLGGTLGLFIGLSFISFVEFIEIGLKLISFQF